jgi:hypothetical protein
MCNDEGRGWKAEDAGSSKEFPMTNDEQPPMKVSEEAEAHQLELARAQGDAYLKALEEMATNVASDGGMKRAGDYVIAYAVEDAEGMYQMEDGELFWMEPEEANCHIEISVRDAADNRFIPGLTVYVRLTASDGLDVGRHQQEFLWHPWLYHYGRNWKVPGDGSYTLDVTIKAPHFGRHDPENGKRYAEDVEVTFENIMISTGTK